MPAQCTEHPFQDVCICTRWDSTSRYEFRLRVQRGRGWVDSEDAVLARLTLSRSSYVAGCLRYESKERTRSLIVAIREYITRESRNESKCTTLLHSSASSIPLSFTTCSCLDTPPLWQSSLISSCLSSLMSRLDAPSFSLLIQGSKRWQLPGWKSR